MEDAPPGDDVIASIEAANRTCLDAYRRSTRVMAVLEQLSTVNEEFRQPRRRRGAAFTKRNALSIRRLQAAGMADSELDPLIAARATSSKVSRLAYQAFILNERMASEQLVSTSTRLWVNAPKIPTEET